MEVQRMTSISLKKFFPFSQAISLIALLVVGAVASAVALAAEDTSPDLAYKLHYKVTFEPEREGAAVLISVEKGELLTQLQFSNKENIYSDIRATGRLTVKDKRVTWELPQGQARLSYFVKLTKERSPGKYDARVTKDWAIFRGDNLIPPVQTAEKPGAYAIATLEFILPESWGGVETGWPRKEGNTFTMIILSVYLIAL
jgi:hypothetical protein